MLVSVILEIFKFKLASTILVLSCWDDNEQVKFMRQLISRGVRVAMSCDGNDIPPVSIHQLHGILYFSNSNITKGIKREDFGYWNKWVIVGDTVPKFLKATRNDADIVLVTPENTDAEISDVYVHPVEEPSIHPWAYWNTNDGLQIVYDHQRLRRRWNLKKHTLRIATPLGTYSNETYNGTFKEYLLDMSMPEKDSGVRAGYTTALIMIDALNATEEMIPTLLWGTEVNNSSMLLKLRREEADIAGGILRILLTRIQKLDYTVSLWPFHVGFTYLAERESSSNMFAEPFTAGVWWCCLALFIILAFAQRVTSKTPFEKEGAYIAVLATSLQQDASAVPEGVSGRWTFLVLSTSAMLIHAYYTSAIVSTLMNAGRDGLDSLRALGDSKYAIASDDYDYMRFFMFDVKTNWSDMEYLKQKKMTSNLYHDAQQGVKLIQGGQTAYHTEYNQLYPYLRSFTDDEICKVQHVDTIPETLTWVTTTKFGQWTNLFRIVGGWLHETGLKARVVTRLRIRPPPCQAALLAEKVNINDVAPVIIITFTGMVISVIILGMEVLYSKWQKRNRKTAVAFGVVEEFFRD
ncbi:ionotropic receptor 75a-like [Aricia agestis]|uniref:ionotropic receptor 75a-like n=1 Tax=Aricia agestis TaxID=91739 RepID=UPI001C205F12|nr:ionotropic receptor 75a-like [Aricia agestis]